MPGIACCIFLKILQFIFKNKLYFEEQAFSIPNHNFGFEVNFYGTAGEFEEYKINQFN